ncbi:MAG: DUF2812 domain-containing protein [Oscillibacter sp.]|nr:DUF2812 domain-containing protein [Oscillibacter sp.]
MSRSRTGKTCRKRPSCNTYDIPAMEHWLEEKAAEGWQLTAWPKDFTAAEPCRCRFSIQPTPEKDGARWAAEPSPERRELYREFGWEYVCTTDYNAFQVWRSDRPDPVPMNTDPEADSYAYDHLWKELRLRNGIFFAATATFGVFIVNRVLQTGHIFVDVMAGEGTPFAMLFYAVLSLMAACRFAKELYTLRKLILRMKNGLLPEEKRRVPRYLGRKGVALTAVFLIYLMTVFLFSPHEQTWLKEEKELQQLYLSAEDLGKAAEYGPMMLKRKALLGSEYLLAMEGGWDLAGRFPYQRMIHVNQIEVYAPKPSFLAGVLFAEIANGYVKEETGEKALSFTQAVFEDARYFRSPEGVQHLVVKEGGKVLYFRTESPDDLRGHLPEIREILAWEGIS